MQPKLGWGYSYTPSTQCKIPNKSSRQSTTLPQSRCHSNFWWTRFTLTKTREYLLYIITKPLPFILTSPSRICFYRCCQWLDTYLRAYSKHLKVVASSILLVISEAKLAEEFCVSNRLSHRGVRVAKTIVITLPEAGRRGSQEDESSSLWASHPLEQYLRSPFHDRSKRHLWSCHPALPPIWNHLVISAGPSNRAWFQDLVRRIVFVVDQAGKGDRSNW